MHQEPYSARAANASAAAQTWWVNTGLIGDRVPGSQKRSYFPKNWGTTLYGNCNCNTNISNTNDEEV